MSHTLVAALLLCGAGSQLLPTRLPTPLDQHRRRLRTGAQDEILPYN
jgi:hypothetical protein